MVSDQEAVLTADKWAQAYDTIDCRIVARLGTRAPRRYVGEFGTGDYPRPQTADVGYRRPPPDRPVLPLKPYMGEEGV